MTGLARFGPPSRTGRLVLLACVAVGAAVRFTGLTTESFWVDEGWALDIAGRASLGDVVRASAQQVHPPLHFVLLWAWSHVLGSSDAALRAFSALVATASIPAAWALARRLVAPRAALLATAVVALSPLLVRHAHDIKQYSLVLLLATVSTERFLAFAQGRSNRPLVGWAVATTLLAYTHFIGFTAVLAQAALLATGVPRAARRSRALLVPWLAAHAVVALAVAPWVPYVIAAMPHFKGFPGSQSPRALWNAFVAVAGTARGVALLVGLAAAGLALGLRRSRVVPRGLTAALVLGIVPFVVPWVVSALTFPSFATRTAIHGVPPLAAALGAGLSRLARSPRRALAVGLAVSVVALSLGRLRPRVEREQWREAAALVASRARPGDAVLSIGIPDGHLLRRYLPVDGPVVLDGRAGVPSPSPGGPRLFVVQSIHTMDPEGWRERLAAHGWRESAATPLVKVWVLRFDP